VIVYDCQKNISIINQLIINISIPYTRNTIHLILLKYSGSTPEANKTTLVCSVFGDITPVLCLRQPRRINTKPKVEQNGYTTHWMKFMNREKAKH
jgi:hypothetical protein